MSQILAHETEAAEYVIDELNVDGDGNVHYWNKNLYIKTQSGNWISNKKLIHKYLLAMYQTDLGMWVTRINRFNQLYHMLTVLTYRSSPPTFN